jgi:hypothetical protein
MEGNVPILRAGSIGRERRDASHATRSESVPVENKRLRLLVHESEGIYVASVYEFLHPMDLGTNTAYKTERAIVL